MSFKGSVRALLIWVADPTPKPDTPNPGSRPGQAFGKYGVERIVAGLLTAC